jgi:FkbH-like protein
VLGEVGVGGITLGQDGTGAAFADFQKAALVLAKGGILLAIASKNDEDLVFQVFDEHPDMALKRDDIVAWCVNWDDKPANIRGLAESLSLGPSSFVFWDDNPLERERMRFDLPEVYTPEIPEGVHEWPAYLLAMDEFAQFTVTQEDKSKAKQYQQLFAFQSEKKAVVDESSFLKSLAIQANPQPLQEASLARAVQLCNKTNQFNLRSHRYSESDLQKLIDSPEAVASVVRMSDRFGDHGAVGLTIGRKVQDDIGFIDTFLLSCRALGRRLETWMLSNVMNQLKERGCSTVVGCYKHTDRNSVCADFYTKHGFAEMQGKERQDAEVALKNNGIEPDGVLYKRDSASEALPVEAFVNA